MRDSQLQRCDRPRGTQIASRRAAAALISEEARVAIKTLSRLARTEGRVHEKEITERFGISPQRARRILADLQGFGLVHRAAEDGYGLSQTPAAISIAHIVRAIDGSSSFLSCDRVLAPQHCADCIGGEICAIEQVARRLGASAAAILDNVSLAETADTPPG